MGKVDGKNAFKPKHYLLYHIKELVVLYNEKHQEVETTSQLIFTCSNSTIETLEEDVKYVQVDNGKVNCRRRRHQ